MLFQDYIEGGDNIQQIEDNFPIIKTAEMCMSVWSLLSNVLAFTCKIALAGVIEEVLGLELLQLHAILSNGDQGVLGHGLSQLDC